MPSLEQRHYDLIGLGLVALAIFFAFVFYFGWDGGQVGEALADGFLYLFGGVAYLVPLILFGTGAVMVLRPMLPRVRPFQTGAICLALGLMLGMAGGLLGLGADKPRRASALEMAPDFVRVHGGITGEALHWTTQTLVQDVGTAIVFVFLILMGILLLTGASLAGLMQSTRQGIVTTTQRVRTTTGEFSTILGSRRGAEAPSNLPEPLFEPLEPSLPPEVEPVVHATHVEIPVSDQADELPDEEYLPPEPEPEPLLVEPEAETEAFDPVVPEFQAEKVESGLTPMANRRSTVTESDDTVYRLPPVSLLKKSKGGAKIDKAADARRAGELIEALSHFGVEAKVIETTSGPHVTRFALSLAPGTKVSKVAALKDDLAYHLAATDVRILAPIPGQKAVGVEVPNQVRRDVRLGDVFRDAPEGWSPLAVWLGQNISGSAVGTDLAKQPHLLIAGTTGAGKSSCVNSMLASILLRADPNQVRMVLVDPKTVELNYYEDIPHLLTPVVTSPRMAANVLQNLIKEMEARYAVMGSVRARNIVELNKMREKNGEPTLPYILCVIDELADLMMVAPAEVEDAIIRLAQKSRAVGIHLLLATQRPSADIITGMIKANVPARIAFAVSSQTDSRVILDQNGAESLLGKGDMLFNPIGSSRPSRIQGSFIEEDEIERITEFWRKQGTPEIREDLLEAVELEGEDKPESDFDPDADDLLGEAVATVVQMGTASTSMLQRRLRVGYTRAGRLIDMMERRGVISGYEGSKARQVLITEADLPRVLAGLSEPATASAAADTAS
ncbi:MAG: segregation ATPase FtsK/SpoIIIE, family [Thermoleophilaceae bacterium]|jgi:S-DNA-T family DNA segregation ATPase FtsK/SpoIIIE|nr:segregation ATPase FtsK/SpoIIIE, family [Thermoleophilaceae bacterium]